MWRYGSIQILPNKIQAGDSLVFLATRDSFPVAEMERIIPRGQDSERIIIYSRLEVNQCKFVSVVSYCGSENKFHTRQFQDQEDQLDG